MSTIYQKIKDAAEKKRRSFVSLGSEDGTVSPTKLNQTLVQGSAGIGKKFINQSDALMEGFNDTLDEDGATFMDDFHTDFGNGPRYSSPSKFKSPAKKTAAEEAAEGLGAETPKDEKGTNGVEVVRTDREGSFQNEDGDKVRVTDIRTTTAGKKGKLTGQRKGAKMSNEDWKKYLANESAERKAERHAEDVKQGVRTKDEAAKVEDSVEMVTAPKDKTEVTPGTESNYNMGLYESRNVAAAQRVQRRHEKRVERQDDRAIRRYERKNPNSDQADATGSVRDAYARRDGTSTDKDPFNQATQSTKGRTTAETSETTGDGNVKGGQSHTTLDSQGKEVKKKAEANKTEAVPELTKEQILQAVKDGGMLGGSGPKYSKTTASPFKMHGSMYNKNKK